MKTIYFLLVLVISSALFSCSGKNSDELSREEINQTKTEIKTVVKKMVTYAEEANADSTITFFSNNPEFVYVSNGGSLSYSKLANRIKVFYNQISGQQYSIVKEEISFPSKSLALYTAHCLSQTNFKNGGSGLLRLYIQFFTFKKIDNKWKVIYGSESAMEKPSEEADLE